MRGRWGRERGRVLIAVIVVIVIVFAVVDCLENLGNIMVVTVVVIVVVVVVVVVVFLGIFEIWRISIGDVIGRLRVDLRAGRASGCLNFHVHARRRFDSYV